MAKSLDEIKKEEMEQMKKTSTPSDEDQQPVKPDTTNKDTPQGPATIKPTPIKPKTQDTPRGPPRKPIVKDTPRGPTIKDQPVRPSPKPNIEQQQSLYNNANDDNYSGVPYNNNNNGGYIQRNNNYSNMSPHPNSRDRLREMYAKNYERSTSIFAHLPIKTDNANYYQHNVVITRLRTVDPAILRAIGWETDEFPIGIIPSDVTFYLFILFHNAYSQLNAFSKKYLYII